MKLKGVNPLKNKIKCQILELFRFFINNMHFKQKKLIEKLMILNIFIKQPFILLITKKPLSLFKKQIIIKTIKYLPTIFNYFILHLCYTNLLLCNLFYSLCIRFFIYIYFNFIPH